MKFRNKATKEIRKAEMRDDGIYLYSETSEEWQKCDWKVLAKYWEEYREPFSKDFYTIFDGEVKHCIWYRERVAACPDDAHAYLGEYGKGQINNLKSVGLYFETKEEAEKAREKLEAWERLKDKGFEIEKWEWRFGVGKAWIAMKEACPDEEMREDLTFLFGGKE